MGNQKSSTHNQHGSISIKLEKDTYVAGDQVNGLINLHITKPFPTRQIFLIIEGKESVQLVDSRTVYDKNKSNTYTFPTNVKTPRQSTFQSRRRNPFFRTVSPFTLTRDTKTSFQGVSTRSRFRSSWIITWLGPSRCLGGITASAASPKQDTN